MYVCVFILQSPLIYSLFVHAGACISVLQTKYVDSTPWDVVSLLLLCLMRSGSSVSHMHINESAHSAGQTFDLIITHSATEA